MKHARKMILVDAASHGNSNVSSQNPNASIEPFTQAIRSLVNSAEINRSNFGTSTTTVSRLSNELERLLERRDLAPSSKLKLYNQELKRFLFFHRENDRKNSIATGPVYPPNIDATAAEDVHVPEPGYPHFVQLPGPPPDHVRNNQWIGFDGNFGVEDEDMTSLPDAEMGAVGGYTRDPVPYTVPTGHRTRPSSRRKGGVKKGKGLLRKSPKRPVIVKTPNQSLESSSYPEGIQSEPIQLPMKRPSNSRSPPAKRYKSNLPRQTPKQEILRRNRKLKRMGSFDYFEDWISKKKKT